jgi:hypothetical protein
MMDFIDPSAPKTKEYVQRGHNENQKERVAPYKPSIAPQMAALFATSLPTETHKPVTNIVDWSFLDTDDGQPDGPADWVKQHIQRLERWGKDDETHQEIIAYMKENHRWTRNIPPPSTPRRYDPNEPPFTPPTELLDDADDVNDEDL